jgi:hypothetical protein
MDAKMKIVTLAVADRDKVKARAREAFKGKRQGARISFATPELLFRLLTAKRGQLVRAMAGSGPLSIREAARPGRPRCQGRARRRQGAPRRRRPAKTTDGKIVFPFEAIRVDMLLRAA